MPYSPESLGIKAPSGGFKEGGWYAGRQYIGGTLSDVNTIHPGSSQVGAGQQVSQEVVKASGALQNKTLPQMNQYFDQQRAVQPKTAMPVNTGVPGGGVSAGGGMPSAGGGTGAGGTMTPTASLNLPELYKNLYDQSGITEMELALAEKEKGFTEAKGKINDNPYLSEATRGGRVAKLETLHAERTKNERDQIATKRADIETQLNLQTKQFDINSQVAQQAMSQFNTLLSMGALDNASGDTIAEITRSTGIPSDAIYSAINAQKQKNIKTEVITSTNDAGVVTVSVIDLTTGQVINQSSLGAVGNAQTGGGSKATVTEKQQSLNSNMITALESVKNSYGHVGPKDWQGAMASYIANYEGSGDARQIFINNFQQYADPNRGDFDQVYYQRQ